MAIDAKQSSEDHVKKINEVLMNLLNATSSGGDQFVTFKIAGEEYAVDIMSVKEITGFSKLTNIPNAPRGIVGLYNLRGTVVPIMDPREKFLMADKREHDKLSIIVMFQIEDRLIGMLVDEISDVLNINKEDIQDTPDLSTNINTKFIRGMGKVGDKLIIILDIVKVMAVEELSTLENVISVDTQKK